MHKIGAKIMSKNSSKKEKDIMIVKRNGNLEKFDPERIKKAITASAERVMVDLTDEAIEDVVERVRKLLLTQTSKLIHLLLKAIENIEIIKKI